MGILPEQKCHKYYELQHFLSCCYIPIWWDVLWFWQHAIIHSHITDSVLGSGLLKTHLYISHLLNFTWSLCFYSSHRTSMAIQSTGLKWPMTAVFYFMSCNLFLWNTQPAKGKLPALSMKLRTRMSRKALWVTLVWHVIKRRNCLEFSYLRSKKKKILCPLPCPVLYWITVNNPVL
jgi:hypothetical protein